MAHPALGLLQRSAFVCNSADLQRQSRPILVTRPSRRTLLSAQLPPQRRTSHAGNAGSATVNSRSSQHTRLAATAQVTQQQAVRVADQAQAAAGQVVGAVAQLAAEVQQEELLLAKRLERKLQKEREQLTYKVSAIAASCGVTALAIAAVHYRFSWHVRDVGNFPVAEAVCTLLLTFGGVIGMEMYARWAHRVLWHDFQPGWALHKSHHEPRLSPFEANDIFAIANAVPAIALCAYGFLTPTIPGGICFGAGLGITLFGIMYMFVHDGLVHKRFPVGPIAEVPYLKRVAVAHRLHHSEKYGGVPWGMFLGPQELEALGAGPELDRMCAELDVRKPASS